MRILLADDHGIVRRGLKSLLESQPGLSVIGEAADGLEALRLCSELSPDLLIIDISMPLMNGIEERVRDLRGSVTVETAPRGGTTIRVALPLPAAVEVPIANLAG